MSLLVIILWHFVQSIQSSFCFVPNPNLLPWINLLNIEVNHKSAQNESVWFLMVNNYFIWDKQLWFFTITIFFNHIPKLQGCHKRTGWLTSTFSIKNLNWSHFYRFYITLTIFDESHVVTVVNYSNNYAQIASTRWINKKIPLNEKINKYNSLQYGFHCIRNCNIANLFCALVFRFIF